MCTEELLQKDISVLNVDILILTQIRQNQKLFVIIKIDKQKYNICRFLIKNVLNERTVKSESDNVSLVLQFFVLWIKVIGKSTENISILSK